VPDRSNDPRRKVIGLLLSLLSARSDWAEDAKLVGSEPVVGWEAQDAARRVLDVDRKARKAMGDQKRSNF